MGAAGVKLEWQDKRTDERGYYSRCKRYSVSSVTNNGVETWQTWKLAPKAVWFALLASNLKTEIEARQAAQDDADKAVA